jgi:hypothetical protein
MDTDSLFNPAQHRSSTQASTMFNLKVLDIGTNETTEDSPAVYIPADVVHSKSDVISKFSDAKTRLSPLEVQFEAFSCSIEELKKQSHHEAKKNEKTLANIFVLLQKKGSNNTNSTSLSEPMAPSDKANHLNQLEKTSVLSETAGSGS